MAIAMQVPQEVQMADPVEQVAAGHHHTLFLTRSGGVWACGRNSRGQLGLGGKFGSFAATPHRIEALAGEPVRDWHQALHFIIHLAATLPLHRCSLRVHLTPLQHRSSSVLHVLCVMKKM